MVEGLRVGQEHRQLVFSTDPPCERNHPVVVVEGRLKDVNWVTQDADVHSAWRQQLCHLMVIEAHVVTDDVVTIAGPVVLYLGHFERRRVEEVVASFGEGEFELVLLPKPKEHVEERAAARFVRLQEHDVNFGRAHRTLIGHAGIALHQGGQSGRACVSLRGPHFQAGRVGQAVHHQQDVGEEHPENQPSYHERALSSFAGTHYFHNGEQPLWWLYR